MSKVFVKYNLDDQYDREEFNQALKASLMAAALSEIRQEMLRPSYKHGYSSEVLNKVNEEYPEAFQELIKMFNAICEKYDVLDYT